MKHIQGYESTRICLFNDILCNRRHERFLLIMNQLRLVNCFNLLVQIPFRGLNDLFYPTDYFLGGGQVGAIMKLGIT